MITHVLILGPELVTNEIQHQYSKLNITTNTLEPVVEGDKGETKFLLGPNGVDKACFPRCVLQQLDEQAFDTTLIT